MAARKSNRRKLEAPKLNRTLRDLLSRLHRSGEDPVPDGFKTASQWAAEWRISTSTARYHVIRMTAAGMMERKLFRILTANGASYEIAHYAIQDGR